MTSECVTVAGPDLAGAVVSDPERLGSALGRRLRAVEAAVRRLDNLDSRGDRPVLDGVTRADVREFVLRALRVAADRDNDRILRAVAEGTRDAAQLAETLGRPRFALWESISDLVQLGLLERDPIADRVQLTGAGDAVLHLVDQIVDAGESG